MTVLSKYQRLECGGIWHPSPDAQRQDVYVSLGDASLIIRDAADTALAHWSLPAVVRINPGQRPALYSPGPDADELLELEDDMMIDAIRTVGRALAKARARPGRLRRGVLLVSALTLAVLATWWLPGAVTRHTASLVPPGLRGEIGQRLLRDLVPFTGMPCTRRSGTAALIELRQNLTDAPGWSVVVVPSGPALSAHLPGRLILLRADAIEEQDTPDLAAGLILAEMAQATARDPMLDLMEAAGLSATFRLLTRGEVLDTTLGDYAQSVLVQPRLPLPAAALATQFDAAQVPMRPYLAATGQAIAPPLGPTETPVILADATWLRLRSICDG